MVWMLASVVSHDQKLHCTSFESSRARECNDNIDDIGASDQNFMLYFISITVDLWNTLVLLLTSLASCYTDVNSSGIR